MTIDQILSLAVLACTICLFAWGRLRYDLVALLSLFAGLVVGIVPFDNAFHGFSDPVVVVVAAALVVSAAMEKSGIAERLVRPLAAWLTSQDRLAGSLVAMVAVLSAFMKNVGALAVFMPVAVRLARRNGSSPSLLLMPMAFGSLIGGLMTLIGTSPNIIVSRVRIELTGKPFGMFDYTPVGVGIAICGVIFLTFGWRLLPKGRQGEASAEDMFRIEDYLSEVKVPETSPIVGSTVSELEQLFFEGLVTVAAIIRDKGQRYIPGGHWKFRADDLLILEGDPVVLKPLLDNAGLQMVHGGGPAGEAEKELMVAEAVIMPSSPLVGSSSAKSHIRSQHGVAVLAISRGGRHFVSSLHQMVLQVGDVLVIEGAEAALPRVLADIGCLPLAQRNLQLAKRPALVPLCILLATMALIAFNIVPVAVGFFGAALIMILTRSISLREAYGAINWPIILMLGALIPVSDAINRSGTSELIATSLAGLAAQVPVSLSLGMIMMASMLMAPFLHHAATVLVMGPIAASLARKLGLNIDPFLMAVAIGTGCDFLTPIGHQCNTLVMGPGGYRFGDYWRLGLPLSIIVLIVGTTLIQVFWPLR